MISVLFAVLSAAFAQASAGEQDGAIELRWKCEKGETLRYAMTQKVVSDVNGTPVRQQMSTTLTLDVKDADAGGAVTIEARYDAVAARASGIQEYDYDSEKDKEPPDEPAARMMAKLVGQSFRMRMGPDGKVLEVRGYERIVEAMSRGLAEDDGARERARQALGQMFSDEAFRSRMQQLAPPLPAGKVRKGDSWPNDFAIKLPVVGNVSYGIRSTLAGIKDGIAVIDQEIKVEFKGGEDSPLSEHVTVVDAKGRSSALFSIERGHFVSQKASVDMTLVAGKARVPVRVETELKLLDKK